MTVVTEVNHNFNSLAQWLAYCEQLHPQNIELGLERVQKVRLELGVDFSCPVFVVAGTNGKGSTCAMLESILMAAGYRVGVYSSPHLIDFEERCRVNRQMVQGGDLLAHFAAVEAARVRSGGGTLTYFEFTTLAILHYLSEQKLDAVVLEVGLGGRYDAVNIIDNDCALVTCIDVDHVEFLGSNRNQIGWEKAGIMRQGKPVVVSDPNPPESVAAYAQEIGADLYLLGKDYHYHVEAEPDECWSWRGCDDVFEKLPYPALPGGNQFLNGSGVLAALEALRARLPVTREHICQGLEKVALAGRFQIISFPGRPVIVLDVGHNPHAAVALADNLKRMGSYPRTHAVFGAMADKDVLAVIEQLGSVVDDWYFSDLLTARAISASELKRLWQESRSTHRKCDAGQPDDDATNTGHAMAYCSSTPGQALELALQKAAVADRIVVFGSFYTVGGVLDSDVWRVLSHGIE